MTNKAFFAYPSRPKQVGQTIKNGIADHKKRRRDFEVTEWSQNEIAGVFITEPILDNIRESDLVFGDITRLNFNVVFELGYAIGLGKRVILTQFSAMKDEQLIREVGIFDTLGYEVYSTGDQVASIIDKCYARNPIELPNPQAIDKSSPVFLVLPTTITDIEARLNSRIKKARLMFRTYDPSEVGRLSGLSAIQEVCKSAAVATSYLPSVYEHARVHNTRVAFVAGLAFAMEKQLVILSPPDEDVALDFRDIVKPVADVEGVDVWVAAMATEVTALLQIQNGSIRSDTETRLLQKLDLGASAAENELAKWATTSFPQMSIHGYYAERLKYSQDAKGPERLRYSFKFAIKLGVKRGDSYWI